MDKLDADWQLVSSLLASGEPCDRHSRPDLFKLLRETEEAGERRLVNNNAALERNITGLRWLFSPLRTLPFDLLHEIFSLIVGRSTAIHIDRTRLDIPPLALGLAHVCSRWRQAVWACPLWRNIHLTLYHSMMTQSESRRWRNVLPRFLISTHPNPNQKFHRRLDLFDLVVSNSSPALLSLTIAIRCDHPPALSSPELLAEPFLIAFRHRERWKSLTLDISYPAFVQLVTQLPPSMLGVLPNLEMLDIVIGYGNPKQPPKMPMMFRLAPKLTTVRLENIDLHSIALPWSQLRKLELGLTGSLKEQIDRFATLQLLQLESLTISYWSCVHASSFDNIAAFNLPNLHSLSITAADTFQTRFLERLCAPRLQNLSVSYRNHTKSDLAEDNLGSIIQFIQQSGTTLTSLRLSPLFDKDINHPQWILLFQSLPALTSLSLSFGSIRHFPVQLFVALQDLTLLPRLDTLDISIYIEYLARDELLPTSSIIDAFAARYNSISVQKGKSQLAGGHWAKLTLEVFWGQPLDMVSLHELERVGVECEVEVEYHDMEINS